MRTKENALLNMQDELLRLNSLRLTYMMGERYRLMTLYGSRGRYSKKEIKTLEFGSNIYENIMNYYKLNNIDYDTRTRLLKTISNIEETSEMLDDEKTVLFLTVLVKSLHPKTLLKLLDNFNVDYEVKTSKIDDELNIHLLGLIAKYSDKNKCREVIDLKIIK